MAKLIDLSFAGCGFLGIYQIGVLAAIRKYPDTVRIGHCLGASAGSLVATAAVSGLPTKLLEERFRNQVARAGEYQLGAFSPKFDLSRILQEELMEILPDDVHKLVGQRLSISLTDTRLRNRLVTGFESREDLVAALVCSCFLPVFSGTKIPLFRNQKYLDGGLTCQMPVKDIDTVKVSPFSGKNKHISSDYTKKGVIVPSLTVAGENVHLSIANIVRGKHAVSYLQKTTLDNYYNQGIQDADHFMKRRSMINV